MFKKMILHSAAPNTLYAKKISDFAFLSPRLRLFMNICIVYSSLRAKMTHNFLSHERVWSFALN